MFKLTQYSHGAGCGCKISPEVLDRILHTEGDGERAVFPALLVGNEERDDAAVYDWGDGSAVVSTTDFFMPIVDDAFDFGYVAAVNAISDIYAMGGSPLLAIAVLGWPINILPAEVAGRVLQGGRAACKAAGIPLAGGHSIDSPEPVFGLAVTGRVRHDRLRRNGGAKPGAQLFLTKPLGIGILTTAEKKGLLKAEHADWALNTMKQLNRAGERFGTLPYVQAMTDVTGFGLLGHLTEMCSASNTAAILHFDQLPVFDKTVLQAYVEQKSVPGGSQRNWDSYGAAIAGADDPFRRALLTDPQTSGGLLVAVDHDATEAFQNEARLEGLSVAPFGFLIDSQEVLITVV